MNNQQEPIVNLSLSLGVVNYVIQALAARPYAEVKGVIDEVTRQTQEQLQPKPEQPAVKAEGSDPAAAAQ